MIGSHRDIVRALLERYFEKLLFFLPKETREKTARQIAKKIIPIPSYPPPQKDKPQKGKEKE